MIHCVAGQVLVQLNSVFGVSSVRRLDGPEVAVHLIKNVMYHGNVIILLQISLLRRTPSDRIHGDWFHARPHPGRPGGERWTH